MKAFCFFVLLLITSKANSADAHRKRSLKVNDIEYYKSNYFLINENDAKFQLSFKWQLFEDVPLFFGYTQYSLWDAFEYSSPFRETVFNPDIFYRFDVDFFNYSHIDLGLFEHNSNGRAGVESRSYNQSFLRLRSEKVFKSGLTLILENKFYVIYGEGEFNQDIEDFLGHCEMALRLKNIFQSAFEGDEAYFRYVPGKGSTSLFNEDFGFYNLGFRFRFRDSKILPSFLIDYYSGFTETLLDYNQRSQQVRFGVTKGW